MVYAALLLLMLEAVTRGPRFTISLKRSTQNLQLSSSCRPITPSFGGGCLRRIGRLAGSFRVPLGWGFSLKRIRALSARLCASNGGFWLPEVLADFQSRRDFLQRAAIGPRPENADGQHDQEHCHANHNEHADLASARQDRGYPVADKDRAHPAP